MLDIAIIFKDGVLESVLTNDPKHLADQVHLTICNLDSDDLNPTAYQNLINNPAYTEADPDSYRIDNMHAKEEPHESRRMAGSPAGCLG